jgi:hypothetical protein
VNPSAAITTATDPAFGTAEATATGAEFRLGWLMARLFDPRRADLLPPAFPAVELPLLTELDPAGSHKLAVTLLADLLAPYTPRLTAAPVRKAASPEAAAAAVTDLHLDILSEFAGDQRRLGAYQLGLALSDTCWLPSAEAGPDSFIAVFRRDRLAMLTTWLAGAGTALPESSADVVSRSLWHWQDWTTANSGWLRRGDDWSQPVLRALREQGRTWQSVLSGGGYADPPRSGAWLLVVLSGWRCVRLLAARVLRLYWMAAALLAVLSGGLLYLTVAALRGPAQVWGPAGLGAALAALALAALAAGVSRAAGGVRPDVWSSARLDARAWTITVLPDVHRPGTLLAVTTGVLAFAAATGSGTGLAVAGATIAEAAAAAAGVLMLVAALALVFLLQANGGPARRRGRPAWPGRERAHYAPTPSEWREWATPDTAAAPETAGDPWEAAVEETAAAPEETTADASTEPRVVNVGIASEAGNLLPTATTLATGTAHQLRIGIGPRSADSVVENPVPLPLDELAPSSGGWWFDVVASSADVDVAPDAHRMFVPLQGPGWICPCAGEEHTCQPQERHAYLEIPFRTGTEAGPGALRCTIYHENNAVQSIRVAFTTGDASRPPDTLIHGTVDYWLADDLSLAPELAPRQLSIVTNRSFGASGFPSGGTHTIVVKGQGTAPVAVNLTEAVATKTLGAMRAQLTLITLGQSGHDNAYDGDNAAPLEQLTANLKQLARLGSVFWQQAVPVLADRTALRPLLKATATIQIARVTETVFPWALIYDYPHSLASAWVPCELLRDGTALSAALSSYQTACPFAERHALNTLCPYGFWGFRHLIEQPPSVVRGLLQTAIPVPRGAQAAAVRSLDLDLTLSATHLEDLERCLGPQFKIADCDSQADFVTALGSPALPLIYFYCHGKTALLGSKGVDLAVPYLEIGDGEVLGAGDLSAWAEDGQWDPERWQAVPPLVFINGCHTAALSPEQLVTFVDAFAGVEAAGVVGTEIAVAQPVAGRFAELFYQHLTTSPGGLPVGQALRRARLDLLAKGNVAGLAYTAFCSMDLALNAGENAA